MALLLDPGTGNEDFHAGQNSANPSEWLSKPKSKLPHQPSQFSLELNSMPKSSANTITDRSIELSERLFSRHSSPSAKRLRVRTEISELLLDNSYCVLIEKVSTPTLHRQRTTQCRVQGQEDGYRSQWQKAWRVKKDGREFLDAAGV